MLIARLLCLLLCSKSVFTLSLSLSLSLSVLLTREVAETVSEEENLIVGRSDGARRRRREARVTHVKVSARLA